MVEAFAGSTTADASNARLKTTVLDIWRENFGQTNEQDGTAPSKTVNRILQKTPLVDRLRHDLLAGLDFTFLAAIPLGDVLLFFSHQ
jgi:hypothetical protein